MAERDFTSDRDTPEPERPRDQETRKCTMPSCYGRMAERMMQGMGAVTVDRSVEAEKTRSPGLPDWCRTMMARVMSRCAAPRGDGGEAPDDTPGTCCNGSA